MHRIPVVSRSGGIRTEVIESHSRINTSSLDGRGSMPGLPRYRLANGEAVNVQGDDFVDLDGLVYLRVKAT
jgi:hypothetical protein